MTNLFRNKYLIPSTRLCGYDYSQTGYYFVTICTKNRYHYFGDIVDDEMVLNDIGKIADQYWLEIPQHFPQVTLDEFVVMPNHVHGIIIINELRGGGIGIGRDANLGGNMNVGYGLSVGRDAINRVSTTTTTTTMDGRMDNNGNYHLSGGVTGKFNPMGKKTLGEIIRWYKGRCSYEINKIHKNHFTWQPRFYDHIIRDEMAYHNIRQYILNNPMMWNRDRNNRENLLM